MARTPAPAPASPRVPRPAAAGAQVPPTGPGIVVRVSNLHKWYGSVHALDGVNLEIRRGEVMGFLGPNGAGKTTFTKCVLGFLRPSDGRVELFGHDMRTRSREALDRVGVVPDQYDFYGNLTGTQHLDFYGRLHGLGGARLKQRLQEVLTATGMGEFARRRVRGYSHGMKQRLCIAQALINAPDFIIFDEPTNGLDPRGAFETRQLIKRLSRQGTTIFMSSHVLPEVEDVCSRVAILSRGRVLVQAPVSELRARLRGDSARVTLTIENLSPELERVPIARGLALSATRNGGDLVCELGRAHDIPELVAALVGAGARVRGVREDVMGLEQIFLELTKGEGGL